MESGAHLIDFARLLGLPFPVIALESGCSDINDGVPWSDLNRAQGFAMGGSLLQMGLSTQTDFGLNSAIRGVCEKAPSLSLRFSPLSIDVGSRRQRLASPHPTVSLNSTARAAMSNYPRPPSPIRLNEAHNSR
jgi:hypothetical protein